MPMKKKKKNELNAPPQPRSIPPLTPNERDHIPGGGKLIFLTVDESFTRVRVSKTVRVFYGDLTPRDYAERSLKTCDFYAQTYFPAVEVPTEVRALIVSDRCDRGKKKNRHLTPHRSPSRHSSTKVRTKQLGTSTAFGRCLTG